MLSTSNVKAKHLVNYTARQAATPLPCGNCVHCLVNKSRVWKHRLLLENKVSCDSCFVTLTYSEEKLPENNTLVPEHLQKYIKKLRRRLEPQRLRYFAVGEYGTAGERGINPHYHAMVFGCGMSDTELIEDAWDKGHVLVGDVTEGSVNYITGYVLKGMNKEGCVGLGGRHKEFMRSSNRPGIGALAIDKIGKQLKENKFYDNRSLSELSHGKKKLPLGKYLKERLDEKIGVTEQQKCDDLWNYQQELFERHGNNPFYINSILDEKSQQRVIQNKRRKIFQKGKSL